jgi:RNA polymerase sigma-70 factor (ECF subfamily)
MRAVPPRCRAGGETRRKRRPMIVVSDALSDIQLMGEVSAGSVEAFGELYDRYCARAYGVALSVCRDQTRAQDAVQDGFLSVWKSRTTYRAQRGTVTAWVLTVVRHRAIDLARRNEKHDAYRANDDQLDGCSAPDDICETAIKDDDADRLHASLALLPAAQQEVISLAFYGQLSHTEIATRLGLPEGTVKGRIRLGLKKLKENSDRGAA